MAVIIATLVIAAASVFLAPLFLTRGTWRVNHPRLALTLWHASFLGGLASLTASLVWSVVLAVGFHDDSARAVQGLWLEPTAIALISWVGLGTFGGLIALAASRFEPMDQTHRVAREQLEMLTATSAYRVEQVHGVRVVFVECRVPIAVGVPHGARMVVISSEIEERLDADQLRAVVEHERAHLVHRHDRVALLAQLNAACLPRLRGARELERATALLIELIADDVAARWSSAQHLADALIALAALRDDEGMSLRAERIRRSTAATGSRPPHHRRARALLARFTRSP